MKSSHYFATDLEISRDSLWTWLVLQDLGLGYGNLVPFRLQCIQQWLNPLHQCAISRFAENWLQINNNAASQPNSSDGFKFKAKAKGHNWEGNKQKPIGNYWAPLRDSWETSGRHIGETTSGRQRGAVGDNWKTTGYWEKGRSRDTATWWQSKWDKVGNIGGDKLETSWKIRWPGGKLGGRHSGRQGSKVLGGWLLMGDKVRNPAHAREGRSRDTTHCFLRLKRKSFLLLGIS